MPRKQIQYLPMTSPTKQKKSTISQYFSVTSCASCEQQTHEGLCNLCLKKPQSTMVILQDKLKQWEDRLHNIRKVITISFIN